jgi:outer membrane murein-binding lipoprotein Lpp
VDDRDERQEDWQSTTAVQRYAPGLAWLPRWIRQRLTPAAVWSAVIVLATAVGYVVNARHALNDAQASVHRLQASVASLERDREELHRIDTQLAVMNSKLGDIETEVDRQREWREKIEGVAELPPHARRRK